MNSPRPPTPDEIAALLASVRAELASREWDSLEELQAHVNRLMARQNAAPRKDLGGLSPDDLAQLLYGDWNGSGPLRLVRDLPLSVVEVSPWFVVARLLMQIIEGDGPVKLTPAGNLPKAVVRRLVESVLGEARREHWREQGLERVKERDLLVIHVPRVLLDVAGLVRRRKGTLILTKEGRHLLPAARAGELYARLFETCFRQFNLGYLDGAGEHPVFQHLIGYALVRLRDLANQWIHVDRVLAEAPHPDLRAAVPLHGEGWDPLRTMVTTRLLRPLERFGLVEQRKLPRTPEVILPRYEARKTPLYDRFLVDGRMRVVR
jgi:hypothetical protein